MAGGRGSGPQSRIPLEATVRGSAPQPGVTGRGHGSGGALMGVEGPVTVHGDSEGQQEARLW